MSMEHYIAELLYRYNCVVIPGFGAFLTQIKSAVLDQSSNTFYPPTKIVSFNGQLTSNDGLLVSYMAEAENSTYDQMLRKLEGQAKQWNRLLKEGNRISLVDIGDLQLNEDHKIIFEPSKTTNFLTTSFGLSSIVSTPVIREVLKEEAVALEERIPFLITPEQREKSSFTFRPYLKYAAIFLLALSTGMTGYRFYNESLSNRQLVQEEAQQKVSERIQEATFFDASPLELPTITLDVITKKKNQTTHHIVAGAFRYKENADKKIRELIDRGFDAKYLGENKHGLHMVTYSRYTEVKQALTALREIKNTQSSDAWMLSKK